MTKKSEFFNFPPVSAKAWKQQIQYGLKGKDYNELLVWDSAEQIKVKPVYNAEDHHGKTVNQPKSPDEWKIGQIIHVKQVDEANKKALDSLERGAESLLFILPAKVGDLTGLVKGIDLGAIPVHFNIHVPSPEVIEQVRALKNEGSTSLFVHFDAIGNLARTGNWYNSMKEDLTASVRAVRDLQEVHTISVDGTLYQNAGANRIQQLAYMMAHAHEYIHLLNSEDPDLSLPSPVFRLAVDSNYFFEIAKIRALRLLWTSLAREYRAPETCHIVAQPSKRNKTVYEYNSNLLRTTMECMAAVNGGADTVCNLPYDALYHEDNEFGDRIARNQLLILKNESYLGAVTNPADGAYYIENLTLQLAEKALALFKNLEAGGGFLKALKEHTIQKKIKEQASSEQERFDNGTEILVGSNAYENKEDTMKDKLEISPFSEKRSEKTLIEPILERRLAEALEKKRLDNE